MFQASGILYTILILKESQVVIGENLSIVENVLTKQIDSNVEHNESNKIEDRSDVVLKSNQLGLIKNKILDAVRNVVLVLMRQRNGKGRMIVWLLLLSNFLFVGCEWGKSKSTFLSFQILSYQMGMFIKNIGTRLASFSKKGGMIFMNARFSYFLS